MKGDIITDRDTYIQKLKAKIDDWNGEIAQVEKRLEGASEHAKIEAEEKLAELRRYRDDAQARLKELEQETGDAWDKVRERTDAAWESIQRGFTEALDRIRGGDARR